MCSSSASLIATETLSPRGGVLATNRCQKLMLLRAIVYLDFKMKPTQYYYVLKKISSKHPIAGTAINTELDLIREHEKRVLEAEERDKSQLKSRRVTLDRSINVAKKLVNIKSKSQLPDLKHLDRVVTEKSERLARLRYGPSKNSDMGTSLGDMFDYVRKGNHSMAKRFLLGTPVILQV